jgi:hypothetical protein
MMRTILALLVVVHLLAALWRELATDRTAKADPPEKPLKAPSAPDSTEKKKTETRGRGKFTISKETTYVTEPLDKDGYIDYARALNQRLRQGVTPENNANVLIWKALGPHPEGATMPTEFFQWMGIKPPPEKGEYFIDLNEYLKDHLKIDLKSKEAETVAVKQLNHDTYFPWNAKEHPHMAGWLAINEKPLALVFEGTKRANYYSPCVPDKAPKGSSGLIGVRLPGVQKTRWVAEALAARAMLRLGEGNYDGAWEDLLACHRLGRLVGRGANLIEALVGLAIDGLAGVGDIAFLNGVKADAKRLEKCLHDLQELAALPDIAEKVSLGTRFMHLDIIMTIDRQGIKWLEGLSGAPPKDSNPLGELVGELMLKGIDWDPALRNHNRWYDRMTAIARGKDRSLRTRQWEQINADLKAIKESLESGELGVSIVDAKLGAAARGKAVGEILILLMTPSVQRLSDSADRLKQVQDNLCLGFALALYHCEHGAYPKTLDVLAPKYLPQIAQDIFSGKPLIYRPSEKGFVLYSVGMNGKDDGGQGYGDDPPGDDLVIRIPLPQLPRK